VNTVDQRREKLNQVARRGVSIPSHVYAALDADTPPREVRAWTWWAHIWERPTGAGWNLSDRELQAAQESWDASERHVDALQQLAAEREAREAQVQAKRDAAIEAARKAADEALTAELRNRFFSANPAASDDDFARLLPDLRERELLRQSETSAPPLITVHDL
jgi:hypothetical protein